MAKLILCPVCHKQATLDHMPFCSKRCADLDLGNWFKGSYAVAAVENDDDADNEGEPELN